MVIRLFSLTSSALDHSVTAPPPPPVLLKAALNTSTAACSPRFDSKRSRKIFREKIIDVAENSWLKGSGQWLENFDRTDLVLPCGLGHLSLKMQNIEFYITVPPGQNVHQNLR